MLKLCERHPNVLQLKAFYETPVDYLFVFEKLDGGDLFDHIHRQKRFTELEASAVIRDIVTALVFLHDHGARVPPMPALSHTGIAHRDLKPENVLCVFKDRVLAPRRSPAVTRRRARPPSCATSIWPASRSATGRWL